MVDKVKQFVTDHKKEILFACSGIFIYKLGFHNGFNASERAVNNIFEKASRTIQGGKI